MKSDGSLLNHTLTSLHGIDLDVWGDLGCEVQGLLIDGDKANTVYRSLL
jgi:hypothetical protein